MIAYPALMMALVAGGPTVKVGVASAAAGGDAAVRHVEAAAELIARELAGADGIDAATTGKSLDAACVDASCLASATGADDETHLVRAQLSATEQDYDLKLEVLDIRTGAVVASAAGACELCTEVEVGEMITRTAARLREPLSALLSQAAILVVEGAPGGATVAVDGEEVGTAPYQGEVDAGKHQLVVTADGHHSHTEAWLAESGSTYKSTYALEPIDESLRSPTLRRAGWASLGVGLAGIAGGAVILALHNRPAKSSCPDGMTDENGRCPEMYDTLGAGLATMGVGLAATAAGAALLIVDAKKRKRASVAFTDRSVHVSVRF